MSFETIVRAWKDEDFRNNLTDEERALLPKHPVGAIELTNADLELVAGGKAPISSVICSNYNCV